MDRKSLPLRIDRSSREPIYRQLVRLIQNLMQDNVLEHGGRLPSIRDLAESLGVNRNTVARAYRMLEKDDLVQSDVGRGTFVTHGPPGSGRSDGGTRQGVDWERLVSRRSAGRGGILERISVGDGAGRIELTGAVADRDLFPLDDFRTVLAEVVGEMGPSLLDYGSREGYRPLREWIARRLAGQGAPVPPEDVFILNGAQPGLDLIGKLLVDDGDGVVVGSPTYTNAIGAFRLYGGRLIPVPLDDDGMRTDALEEVLSRRAVSLLYCMPTFQNPTGISMSGARRRAILDLARHAGVAILEDTFDADLRYGGREETSFRGLPGGEDVLLLGTFSKILFPGLRLGWLVAPPALHARIRRLRRCTDLTAGLFAQAAIHRFCERGLLDRHLERVCVANRRRLDVLLEAMAEHFPGEVSWTRPQGGMSLWVRLPGNVDAVGVLLEARAEGVNFTPGPLFHAGGGGHDAFRLSFTLEKEERIAEGARILGRILRRRLDGPRANREDAPAAFL